MTKLLSLGLGGVGLLGSRASFSISLVLWSCVRWSSSLHLQILINIPSWVFQSFGVFSILRWCGPSSQQPTIAGGSCQAVSTTWTHPWPGCSATTSCEEGLVYREECQGKGFPLPLAWVCVDEGGRALTTREEDSFLIFWEILIHILGITLYALVFACVLKEFTCVGLVITQNHPECHGRYSRGNGSDWWAQDPATHW